MRRAGSPGISGQEWLSGHLYYHESLDRAVTRFVHPLVVSLVHDHRIDAFFFVRDGLGGPHVRLRLRIPTELTGRAVVARMQEQANRFLRDHPSTSSLDERTIRSSNELIMAADPHEIDPTVYPDNWFRMIPFRPEIERYGGPMRFRASLDFFVLSSVAAIEFLALRGHRSRAVRLTHAFGLLLAAAVGFATDVGELADLLQYGVDSWGQAMPTILEKGDREARSRSDLFAHLFDESVASLRSTGPVDGPPVTMHRLLALGAERLSASVLDAGRIARARIGGSHLHMTATRLGLNNAEEVYLSRLLSATLGRQRTKSEDVLSWIESRTPQPERAGSTSWGTGLVPLALEALAEIPVAGSERQGSA